MNKHFTKNDTQMSNKPLEGRWSHLSPGIYKQWQTHTAPPDGGTKEQSKTKTETAGEDVARGLSRTGERKLVHPSWKTT